MKSFISPIVLCLCASLSAHAQISEICSWYNGVDVYSATTLESGSVLMTASAEGEEQEFLLLPVPGKYGTYNVTDGPNGGMNFFDGCTVRHEQDSMLDALCFYGDDGRLKAVMSNEAAESDAEVLNRKRWISQIAGDYFFNEVEGETQIGISGLPGQDGRYGMTVDGVITKLEVVTFNGIITGFIRVSEMGGTPLMGTWEVVPSLDGLVLYYVEETPDSYFFEWKRTGMAYYLTKSDSGSGQCRFDYALTTLLNDKQFRRMDKEALRVMRNYILARHGYRFSSQDLQQYFGKEGWYKPRSSNDGISGELTLIERLNIELIKSEEN